MSLCIRVCIPVMMAICLFYYSYASVGSIDEFWLTPASITCACNALMGVSVHFVSCAWALFGYCESWWELGAVTSRFCYDLVDASSLPWLIGGVYISVGPRVLWATACFLKEIAVCLMYDPIVYTLITATRWVMWGARVIKKDVVSVLWPIQSVWYRCTRVCLVC